MGLTLNDRPRAVFAAFALGIVAALTVSLISLALIQAGLGSYLLANRDSLVNYTSVVNDSSKLRFTLSMNSSTLSTGQAVEIKVSEQNTLLLTNTVPSAHGWPATELTAGPCGVMNYPMGFAIYEGYQLQNNLPSADRLALYGSGFYFCPLILFGINSYTLAPGSDSATINAGSSPNPSFTIPIQSQGTFNGYWSSSIPYLSTPTFHSFSPGVYTVVGGDEWGDLLVLHFVVS
jgi:hypothetical protein